MRIVLKVRKKVKIRNRYHQFTTSDPEHLAGWSEPSMHTCCFVRVAVTCLHFLLYYSMYILSYYINVLQQTACLVVNPITDDNFAFLFNCTPMGGTTDSMTLQT